MKCSRLERTLCFWTVALLFTPTGTVALLWVIPTLPLGLLWDERLFHRVSNRYQSPQALAMGNSKVYSSPWESNSWPKWKLSAKAQNNLLEVIWQIWGKASTHIFEFLIQQSTCTQSSDFLSAQQVGQSSQKNQRGVGVVQYRSSCNECLSGAVLYAIHYVHCVI